MQVQKMMQLVRIKESIFGLPWVISGALLPFVQPEFAQAFAWSHWWIWCWILCAFLSARVAGMSFNRLIDKAIDAANPRTKHRMVAKGEISTFEVGALAVICCLIFLFCCWMINETCFFLAPFAIALLVAYSYTKRFTYFCHFVLGVIQLCGPVFAWAAITNQLDWPPVILGMALLCSITANDVIYALQDLTFDKQYGLKSIPVLVGIQKTIWISRLLQGMAVVFLLFLGIQLDLPYLYYCGIAIIAYIYGHFQQKIDPHSQFAINHTFFRSNSYVALTLMFTIIGSIIWLALL